MAARRLVCAAARPGSRRLMSTFQERQASEEMHAISVKKTWKRISLFICLPTVSYFTWKSLIVGDQEHLTHNYVPWSHLRIRTKPFPWGDGDLSLFHNSKTNPRPDSESDKAAATPSPSLSQRVGSLWVEYLHEDAVKREQERWKHLEKMQHRKEQHLARKKAKDVPIHPMNLTAEVKIHKPNQTHSGIDY